MIVQYPVEAQNTLYAYEWVRLEDEKTGERFWREIHYRGEIRCFVTDGVEHWHYWAVVPPVMCGGHMHYVSGVFDNPDEAIGLVAVHVEELRLQYEDANEGVHNDTDE